ncbi:TadE/TadG family type IV pilus assembly protein [Alkalihalobacillus sp. 1P02AB]|uniref:TadE/TadG family type IV pilus assembly protein n=1 Tax=Alkalihalobacillus sp. 1P02AB TaxID=3132260 RepID=UPI0039A5ABE8
MGTRMLKRFMRREDGSLTLEAAMVMPVFLLFTVFLAMMIRISVADMALKQAVSETTQIVATHAYPAALIVEGGANAADNWIKNFTEEEFSLTSVENLVQEVLGVFGIEIMDVFGDAAVGATQPFVETNFGRANSDGLFDPSRVNVTNVDLDVSGYGLKGYFGITATYEVPIIAPFVNRTITLEQSAYEKIWTGS